MIFDNRFTTITTYENIRYIIIVVMNIFATAILFINTKSFLVIPAALILHVFGYLMCLRDQRYFDLLACRILHTPPRTPPATRKAMGGQTYDPF